MPLDVCLYFFRSGSFTSSENVAKTTFKQLLQKNNTQNPRGSSKDKRKGNNNYFLHLKREGMLHEGSYNLIYILISVLSCSLAVRSRYTKT